MVITGEDHFGRKWLRPLIDRASIALWSGVWLLSNFTRTYIIIFSKNFNNTLFLVALPSSNTVFWCMCMYKFKIFVISITNNTNYSTFLNRTFSNFYGRDCRMWSIAYRSQAVRGQKFIYSILCYVAVTVIMIIGYFYHKYVFRLHLFFFTVIDFGYSFVFKWMLLITQYFSYYFVLLHF